MVRIETRRLVLRPYRVDDWEQVHSYAALPEFSRYDVWGPNSPQETQQFIADCIASMAAEPIQRYELAAELRVDGRVIGGGTLKRNARNPRVAGIGYAVNPTHQRLGYATEIAIALIGFAFGELGASRVVAQCDTRNVASRRVMEKAGMKLTGLRRRHQEIRGVPTDTYRYELWPPDGGRR